MAAEAPASALLAAPEQVNFEADRHDDRQSKPPSLAGSGRAIPLDHFPGHHDVAAHDPARPGTDHASLAAEVSEPGHDTPLPLELAKSLAIRLYLSHFLSTWNSRLFETAVVYFLATIFPGNLLPISAYAIGRNVAAIALTCSRRYLDRRGAIA